MIYKTTSVLEIETVRKKANVQMKRQYRRIVGKYKMYLYELQKGEEKWASNLFWIMLWSLVLSSFDIVDFWSYLQIIAGVPNVYL